jgi:hypothetical protein
VVLRSAARTTFRAARWFAKKIRAHRVDEIPVETVDQTILGRELNGNPAETVAAQLTPNCPLPNRSYGNQVRANWKKMQPFNWP